MKSTNVKFVVYQFLILFTFASISIGTFILPTPVLAQTCLPTLLGSYVTPHTSTVGIYVSGNTAYVADQEGFKIIDVSNPSSPTLLSSLATGWVEDVYVSGSTAYVAGSTLHIIDVSNPAQPTRLGYVAGSGSSDVYVSGSIAYVAGYVYGLHIIDVSNPSSPTRLLSFPTGGYAYGVYVSDSTAYVADGPGGFKIVSVSLPWPTLLGSFATRFAYDVYVSGSTAYVSDYYEGLKIIDVSNPAQPTLLGTYEPAGGTFTKLYVSGSTAYVAGSPLHIIDVSNPAQPTLLGYGMGVGDVYVSGSMAYVADGWDGLRILDVSGCGGNNPPTANAGFDQTVHVGRVVTLDGSGSADPDGNVPLTYNWSFVSKPLGSTALLSNPAVVNPTFTPDIPGNYVIQLVVTDNLGAVSVPDTAIISTTNTAPVAAAGPDQAVILIGTTVQLNGTTSYDVDGDPITYQWSFVSRPAGSIAALTGANTATPPTFVADVHGDYVVQLVVSDPWTQSTPDTVIVSFTNVAPVANAGASQSVVVGTPVTLDGSGSSDANGDILTHSWAITSAPPGSTATIADPTVMVTYLVPDLQGTYVVQLIVNDGFVDSVPSTIQVQAVTLETIAIQAIQGCQAQIASLSPTVVKNPNMQNALLNKLNAVIANIEAGLYADALGQLQNDILGKTDGCANAGAPDMNDWIKDCAAQGLIYPLVLDAIAKVQALL